MTFNSAETGNRIKAIRKRCKITAVKASNDLAIALGTYRKIESGERGMSVDNLLMIAEYYGVTTDYLLKGESSNRCIGLEIDHIIEKLQILKETV